MLLEIMTRTEKEQVLFPFAIFFEIWESHPFLISLFTSINILRYFYHSQGKRVLAFSSYFVQKLLGKSGQVETSKKSIKWMDKVWFS